MTIPKRAVVVRQLPEIWDAKQENVILREIQNSIDVDRPRVVLDCSNLRHLDSSAVHLLLCCLESAMRRNGDVRLAGLPPGAEAALKFTGGTRLFDVFETVAEAVSSYHQLPADTTSRTPAPVRSHREPESVA